jgi:hypothetical protein
MNRSRRAKAPDCNVTTKVKSRSEREKSARGNVCQNKHEPDIGSAARGNWIMPNLVEGRRNVKVHLSEWLPVSVRSPSLRTLTNCLFSDWQSIVFSSSILEGHVNYMLSSDRASARVNLPSCDAEKEQTWHEMPSVIQRWINEQRSLAASCHIQTFFFRVFDVIPLASLVFLGLHFELHPPLSETFSKKLKTWHCIS